MLAGPRSFNGGVKRQQVGLAGDGLDHQGDALDFFAALAQGLDQLAAGIGTLAELVHAGDRLGQHFTAFGTALMGLAGSVQGLAAQLGGDLFGTDHHFGAADNLLGGAQLRLHAGRQLLDRIGHAGGGQRVMAGGIGQVAGQLADAHRWRQTCIDARFGDLQAGQPDHQQGQWQAEVQRQAGKARPSSTSTRAVLCKSGVSQPGNPRTTVAVALLRPSEFRLQPSSLPHCLSLLCLH